jgi:hypothetical protein
MAARQYRSTVEAKTLSAAINSSVTSMTLNSVTTLPSAYQYTLVIDPDTATEEIVTVTANAGGNTLTIVRGQDGTSAQAHATAAVVKHMITARDLQEPQDHIAAVSGVHGITGTIAPLASPTFTGTVTLPSGTVTSTMILDGTIVNADINASAAIAASKLSGVVTPTSTDTLTNKTLTSPVITGGTLNAGVALTVDSTELNILDGATLSTTELNYVDGVTSAIQTQLTAGSTALTTHEADTTSIHGITDTSKLAKFGSAAAGRTIFVQTTTPTALATGDIWIDY